MWLVFNWNSILLNHWKALQSWLIHPHTNFQLILLNHLSGRSGILLVILDPLIITHWWFFRCIFMVFSLISFKPQKVWGSMVNLPLYLFSSCHALFTLWVWQHVGVIFVINSRVLIVFLIKHGTKMHPYTTFLCTKFQGNLITHFYFMVTFRPWRKEQKKDEKKETKPIFESLYLGNSWCDLVEIWNVGYWGHLHSQNHVVSYKQHKVLYTWKLHYCSSCQYTHGVAHWLLGPHDTLPCVLINPRQSWGVYPTLQMMSTSFNQMCKFHRDIPSP